MRIYDMKFHTLGFVYFVRMLSGLYNELGAHKSAEKWKSGMKLFLCFSHVSQNPWRSKIWNFTTWGFIILMRALISLDHELGGPHSGGKKRIRLFSVFHAFFKIHETSFWIICSMKMLLNGSDYKLQAQGWKKNQENGINYEH